jgi:hypothetical protein
MRAMIGVVVDVAMLGVLASLELVYIVEVPIRSDIGRSPAPHILAR